MTLTQLEYILALAKHRHFGKAAESCHISQPSLSIQIQNLEDELGTKLFERSKTSFAITEVGKAVIEQARLILGESRRLHDIVSEFSQELKGRLKLGIIPTIAPYLLPRLLPELARSFPKLTLDIFEQKTSDLVELIHEGEIDAAILSTPRVVPETLKEKVLYYEPFLLFASPAHALLKKPALALTDLEDFAPQLLDEAHCMRDQVEKLCGQSRRQSSGIEIRTGTLQSLIEVVNHTGGYTLIPALAREAIARFYPDQFLEFAAPKPSRKISLIFHRSFLKRPFIEGLSEILIRDLPSSLIAAQMKAQTKIIDPDKSRFQ